jgi:hypothetical protein
MALSRSAVDKLGDRLRTGNPTDADWTLLEELRAERQRQLDGVVGMLRRELAIEVTSRVKTTNTLVEKLQRERMRLSQMDDVAGARIKVNGTRLDQDALVQRLVAMWPDARVKDRRERPVHGYRAVHVIPSVDGWPLEIQVRTHRQDTMANIFEGLADRWGRQIRYGGKPEDPEVEAFGPGSPPRGVMLDTAAALAQLVASLERDELNETAHRFVDNVIAGFVELLDE